MAKGRLKNQSPTAGILLEPTASLTSRMQRRL